MPSTSKQLLKKLEIIGFEISLTIAVLPSTRNVVCGKRISDVLAVAKLSKLFLCGWNICTYFCNTWNATVVIADACSRVCKKERVWQVWIKYSLSSFAMLSAEMFPVIRNHVFQPQQSSTRFSRILETKFKVLSDAARRLQELTVICKTEMICIVIIMALKQLDVL